MQTSGTPHAARWRPRLRRRHRWPHPPARLAALPPRNPATSRN